MIAALIAALVTALLTTALVRTGVTRSSMARAILAWPLLAWAVLTFLARAAWGSSRGRADLALAWPFRALPSTALFILRLALLPVGLGTLQALARARNALAAYRRTAFTVGSTGTTWARFLFII